MNTRNTTTASSRQQATALVFATLVTLWMLGGINLLATQGGTDAQMAAARVQQQATAASTAKGG